MMDKQHPLELTEGRVIRAGLNDKFGPLPRPKPPGGSGGKSVQWMRLKPIEWNEGLRRHTARPLGQKFDFLTLECYPITGGWCWELSLDYYESGWPDPEQHVQAKGEAVTLEQAKQAAEMAYREFLLSQFEA